MDYLFEEWELEEDTKRHWFPTDLVVHVKNETEAMNDVHVTYHESESDSDSESKWTFHGKVYDAESYRCTEDDDRISNPSSYTTIHWNHTHWLVRQSLGV